MKEVRSRFGSWLLLVAVLVVASVASASSLYFGLADAQRPREGHWFVYALVALALAVGLTLVSALVLAKLRPRLGFLALPVVAALELLGLVLVWLVFEVTIV